MAAPLEAVVAGCPCRALVKRTNKIIPRREVHDRSRNERTGCMEEDWRNCRRHKVRFWVPKPLQESLWDGSGGLIAWLQTERLSALALRPPVSRGDLVLHPSEIRSIDKDCRLTNPSTAVLVLRLNSELVQGIWAFKSATANRRQFESSHPPHGRRPLRHC